MGENFRWVPINSVDAAGTAIWMKAVELNLKQGQRIDNAKIIATKHRQTKRVRVIDISSLPNIPLTSCHLPLPEIRHACPFVFLFAA